MKPTLVFIVISRTCSSCSCSLSSNMSWTLLKFTVSPQWISWAAALTLKLINIRLNRRLGGSGAFQVSHGGGVEAWAAVYTLRFGLQIGKALQTHTPQSKLHQAAKAKSSTECFRNPAGLKSTPEKCQRSRTAVIYRQKETICWGVSDWRLSHTWPLLCRCGAHSQEHNVAHKAGMSLESKHIRTGEY